jgi:hypothetical protein
MGVDSGVIAAGALMVLAEAGVPLDFDGPGFWAGAAVVSRKNKTSVGAYLFMADFLPKIKLDGDSLAYASNPERFRN